MLGDYCQGFNETTKNTVELLTNRQKTLSPWYNFLESKEYFAQFILTSRFHDRADPS
jgi:hypothetical protein